MLLSSYRASSGMSCMANGKLYISGEYAVVDGAGAVISAVNRELTARIVAGEETTEYPDGTSVNLTQILDSGMRVFDLSDDLRYVKAGLYVAARYVRESGKDVPKYVMYDITSHLVDESGRKFGLGSSGAVTVAIISAFLEEFADDTINVSRETLYKLSVLALLLAGDNGSFGDVACSSFGQLIYYVRPSMDYMRNMLDALRSAEHLSVVDAVEQEWAGLIITPLIWPEDLVACVGWTGHPASSHDLVNAVRGYKKNHAEKYQKFVSEADVISRTIRDACVDNDTSMFLAAYRRARNLMSHFSVETGGFAETAQLAQLQKIASDMGWVAKFSGAGGGDCGIAITSKNNESYTHISQLAQKWTEAGIEPMPWKLG